MQFRADISIRVRGQTPADWREFKSEDYDSDEDFAEAVRQMVLDNLGDIREGQEDDDTDITGGILVFAEDED